MLHFYPKKCFGGKGIYLFNKKTNRFKYIDWVHQGQQQKRGLGVKGNWNSSLKNPCIATMNCVASSSTTHMWREVSGYTPLKDHAASRKGRTRIEFYTWTLPYPWYSGGSTTPPIVLSPHHKHTDNNWEFLRHGCSTGLYIFRSEFSNMKSSECMVYFLQYHTLKTQFPALDSSTLPKEEEPLCQPPLKYIAAVLQVSLLSHRLFIFLTPFSSKKAGLRENFAEATVTVEECPDLRFAVLWDH